MVDVVQRAPAEVRYTDELARLGAADKDPAPAGWRLSPRAVRRSIMSDDATQVSQKLFDDDPLVDRVIVSLMGQQGLMLVGEPATAKSPLSDCWRQPLVDRQSWLSKGLPRSSRTICDTGGIMRCCLPKGQASAHWFPARS